MLRLLLLIIGLSTGAGVWFGGAGAWFGAQTSTTHETVYGTYHIKSWGQTGSQLFSSSKTDRTYREEKEVGIWEITLDRDSKGKPTCRVHIEDFNHEVIYTQEFLSPGPVDKIVTKTLYTFRKDRPDTNGTLEIVETLKNGKPYHQLVLSNQPAFDGEAFETITKHFRDPHHKAEETTSQSYPMLDVRLHMDLDWSDAIWTSPYAGSINTINRYGSYHVVNRNTYWLNVKANWQLRPR